MIFKPSFAPLSFSSRPEVILHRSWTDPERCPHPTSSVFTTLDHNGSLLLCLMMPQAHVLKALTLLPSAGTSKGLVAEKYRIHPSFSIPCLSAVGVCATGVGAGGTKSCAREILVLSLEVSLKLPNILNDYIFTNLKKKKTLMNTEV